MLNKIQSYIRYHITDQVLIEKGRAGITELLDSCIELTGDNSLTKEILEEDIRDMKLSDPPGYYAPIGYDSGKEVYYYENADFSLNKIPMGKEESMFLESAVSFISRLKDHYSLQGLKGVLQKITDTIRIRNLSENGISPDFVQSELPKIYGGSQFLKPIIEGIQQQKVLRIYYQPFYEDKPYFTLVHPYLLKEYKNRWYLTGLNETKAELRTYGLDRIWEIQQADIPYIPKKFSAKQYFRNTIGVIAPMGPPPEIRLSVLRYQANYLITLPLHESQFIESENEERVVFSYKVHPTYEFKAQILSMGPDVRVLSPDSLKKNILKLLNDSLLNYGKGDL